MLRLMFVVYLATFGFAIMFNIKGKTVWFAALAGSIGAAIYYLTTVTYQTGIFLSMFYTSMAMTLYAEIMARKMKTPVTLFLICGLITYVPGGTMYYMMKALLDNDMVLAGAKCMEVLLSSGALAAGIVVVSTFVKIYFKIKSRRAVLKG